MIQAARATVTLIIALMHRIVDRGNNTHEAQHILAKERCTRWRDKTRHAEVLDRSLVWYRDHRLGNVVFCRDDVGAAGEDLLAAEVDALCISTTVA